MGYFGVQSWTTRECIFNGEQYISRHNSKISVQWYPHWYLPWHFGCRPVQVPFGRHSRKLSPSTRRYPVKQPRPHKMPGVRLQKPEKKNPWSGTVRTGHSLLYEKNVFEKNRILAVERFKRTRAASLLVSCNTKRSRTTKNISRLRYFAFDHSITDCVCMRRALLMS